MACRGEGRAGAGGEGEGGREGAETRRHRQEEELREGSRVTLQLFR